MTFHGGVAANYGSGQFELVTFGRVKNASVKLYNAATNQASYQYDLTQDAAKGTSVDMVRFVLRHLIVNFM